MRSGAGLRTARPGSVGVALALVGIIALGAVFTWLRVVLPCEAAFITPDTWDWTADGVVVEPLGAAGPFLPGDRVMAIDGVPLEVLASENLGRSGTGRAASPAPAGRAAVPTDGAVFEVDRDGVRVALAATLAQRPVGGLLAAALPLLAFTVVQAGVALMAWLRRPAEGWRRGFLIGSVANMSSAVVWELGLRPTDLARPEPMLLLFAVNAPLHILFWSSVVHVMVSWPARAGGVFGHRWFVPALYIAPQVAFLAGAALTAVAIPSVLAWIGMLERVIAVVILALIALVLVVLSRVYRGVTRGDRSLRFVVAACFAGALAVALLTVVPILLTRQALAPRSAVAALGLPLAVVLLVGTVRSRLFEVDVLLASRRRLVVAREEERRRIRRDLHDGLGPMLAAMTLKADLARDVVRSDPAAADAALASLKADTQAAVAEIRRLTRELRPPALDELGVVDAVRQRAVELGGDGPGRVEITVTAAAGLPRYDAATEVAAYRIAVEAMTNVVRHAGARHCLVRFAGGPALEVEIRDDGAGFAGDRGAGVGLTSMRERCAELGGRLEVGRTTDGWTVIGAKLPGGR